MVDRPETYGRRDPEPPRRETAFKAALIRALEERRGREDGVG
jgi:hypothetical protein